MVRCVKIDHQYVARSYLSPIADESPSRSPKQLTTKTKVNPMNLKTKAKVYQEAIWFFADLIAQNLDVETYGEGKHPNTDALIEKSLDALDTIRILLPEQEILDDVLRNVLAKRKADPFTL
jgi:hypothetical protein